ncbi:mariner Mos1 transposase [Trichonephila clavipes]|nr:mariner Mos1 transposase [Trichonephila clavipes]
MSNFMPSDHDLRTALMFCYHLEKNATESHQMLVEAYVCNALSRVQRYRWFEKFQNGDFDVRNARSVADQQKKFEDAELQALLDEDDSQTQEHLAEQLNVDQSTVSRRLKAMGKIIKVGRSVPHELTDRQKENRKLVCEMLLARCKRKSYLHRILTGEEKWIYFENPSVIDHMLTLESRPNRPQARIASAARQCCVFSGIRRDQSIMSFSNPAKPLILIPTSKNYLI